MINVLVVDDSALMRKMISELISSDKNINVIGTAKDGDDVLSQIPKLKPDVISLDLEMPGRNTNLVIKDIVSKYKLPIVIVSSFSKEGSQKTLDAMEAGAVDFMLKPSATNMAEIQIDLIAKIKGASVAVLKKFKPITKAAKRTFDPSRKKIIVIAASTGGPPTLEALLVSLPKNIPAPILIVQHMPAGFTKSFADRLDKQCEINVREAKEGDELENGTALIAPGGYHMELVAEVPGTEGSIKLNQKPYVLGVRPNANILFNSVSKIFKENTIGVVLTGMGRDGTDGSGEIKNNNGTIIAQDESTSIIYGMPKEVAKAGFVDEVLPIDNIPVALIQVLEI